MEKAKAEWTLEAPQQHESFAAAHPDAFCVLDAGAKGAGLFATRPVARGTYLFDYTGELLDQTQYQARYPDRVSDYTAAIRAPDGAMHFVDGRDPQTGSPSRFMNHDDEQPTVGRRSFFPPDGSSPRILMYALREIHTGDEMQWDYGPGFWAAHRGKVE
jgi:SET domain-containing protein